MNNGQVIQAFIQGVNEAKANFLYIAERAETTELISFGGCVAIRIKRNGKISINEDIPNRRTSLSHREEDRARHSVQLRLINTVNAIDPNVLMPVVGVGFEVTCNCPSCNEKLTVKAPTKKVVDTWDRATTCHVCLQKSLVLKTADGVAAILV